VTSPAGGAVHPALAAYLALLAAADPFAAHEALEAAWRCPGDALEHTDAAQALIQVAAAYVHRGHDNARGARTLVGRAAARLRRPCTEVADRALAAAHIDRLALADRLVALGPMPEAWPEALELVVGRGVRA
jgi:predicted metal-dependent hydrolase